MSIEEWEDDVTLEVEAILIGICDLKMAKKLAGTLVAYITTRML